MARQLVARIIPTGPGCGLPPETFAEEMLQVEREVLGLCPDCLAGQDRHGFIPEQEEDHDVPCLLQALPSATRGGA